jgi:hypothetical protein
MNEAHSKIQYVLVTRQIKDVTEERLLILHFEQKIQKIQKIKKSKKSKKSDFLIFCKKS